MPDPDGDVIQPSAPDCYTDRSAYADGGQTPPFVCYNPYCLHKGRWWTSILGVTRCSNCRPPSFPWLVRETNDPTL